MTTPIRTRGGHGGVGMYRNHGCRCRLCREAIALKNAQSRARKAGRPVPEPSLITAQMLQVQPYRPPRCTRCPRWCADSQGQPRFVLDHRAKPLCFGCAL